MDGLLLDTESQNLSRSALVIAAATSTLAARLLQRSSARDPGQVEQALLMQVLSHCAPLCFVCQRRKFTWDLKAKMMGKKAANYVPTKYSPAVFVGLELLQLHM